MRSRVNLPATIRQSLAAAALLFALPRAPALLNIDGTRNQLFVFGNASFAYSSNIFSDATDRADYFVTTGVGVELKRRAGIIAVDATARIDYVRYRRYSEEDAVNPGLLLEFNKSGGRMTGSLTVHAFRESRSDSAINLRTNAWNFPVALSLKYPINEKYYLTSQTEYLHRQYTPTPGIVNYTDYAEGVDVYYTYTSKLDLVGGYRLRISHTTGASDTYDHWFNLGVTGGLFSKMSGSVRVGYQIRNLPDGQTFTHVNALASTTWPITRKLSLNGEVSRDFNTVATGANVDSTSVSLTAIYSFNRKVDFRAGVAYGRNQFLGLDQASRRDHFISYDVGAHYKMNDHFQLGVSYAYFRNWSNLTYSAFDRQGFSVDLSSRF